MLTVPLLLKVMPLPRAVATAAPWLAVAALRLARAPVTVVAVTPPAFDVKPVTPAPGVYAAVPPSTVAVLVPRLFAAVTTENSWLPLTASVESAVSEPAAKF